MKKVTSWDKLGLAFALIMLGLIFVLGQPQGLPDLTNYSFASEPVRVAEFEITEVEESQKPRRLLIPDLTIDLEVDQAPIVNGYWQVFVDKAGWGEGSGFPGAVGNQVIFAHAREGLFLPLKDVTIGQKVYILTEAAWYEYRVEEINEVYPNQTEVIGPTDDERLTLYTCSGFADTKRLIVF